MLEAHCHEENAFATLTFDDEHLPADLSVSPRDVSAFIKRLRKNTGLKIRYFAVGEYGDTTGRPHYHLALFGYPKCLRGRTDLRRQTCCPSCTAISEAWQRRGAVELAILEPKSARYIAGYIQKKMTRHDDERLEGRLPEFARMSLRPGLGLFMMHDIASHLLDLEKFERMIDVPLELQHGRKRMPLGRYLRRKLRTFVGRDEKTPQSVLDQQKEELRPLRETAFRNSRPFKEEILKASEGRRIQLELKNKSKKGHL